MSSPLGIKAIVLLYDSKVVIALIGMSISAVFIVSLVTKLKFAVWKLKFSFAKSLLIG